MKGEKHFWLQILCVDPEHQRMGIGAKLLEWGVQGADDQGVKCWIEASPFGKGLYKKYGWEEVGLLDVDVRK